MDKKFMRIKRIILPVMTVVVLTSQLMGCASVSSNEMLEMLNQGESIEIEVAMPSYYEEEQGTEVELDWKELGSLDTYKEFRLIFDDTFMNYSFGEGQKNGPAYINLDGTWTNNSTLKYAMLNKVFAETLSSTSAQDSLSEAIENAYVDIDSNDTMANKQSAVINAYFNIFKDNETGYANMNSTLSRIEFLAGLTKVDTPVSTELESEPEIEALTDDSLEAKLASQSIQYSYLDLESKSFDELTSAGTISRAEAVYSIVQKYFSDEYNASTGKEGAYADTKNAGDIATRSGLIKDGSYAPRYKAGILSLMMQNPDKGMDDSLYKAMVIAKQYRIIETSDSNWDEALTKGEAIQLFLNTYKALVVRDGYSTTSDQGTNEGTAIDRETNSSENTSETNGSDIEFNGEAVGNTALTQEEIDALKAQASEMDAKWIDIYKTIMENGSYTDSAGVTWDKVVGTPGDTSWRRMSDEEANAIISKGKPDPFENPDEAYEYQTAEAELSAGTWNRTVETTIYFDYYAYQEARDKSNKEWREDHADEGLDTVWLTPEEEEAINNW